MNRMSKKDRIQFAAKRQLGVYPETGRYIRIAGIRKLPLINEDGSFACPSCRKFVGWHLYEVMGDYGGFPPPVLVGICRHCDFEFLVESESCKRAGRVGVRHALSTHPGMEVEDFDPWADEDFEWEDDGEDDFENLL